MSLVERATQAIYDVDAYPDAVNIAALQGRARDLIAEVERLSTTTRGAVDRAEKAEALVRRLVALMGDTAKELLPGELESSELLRRSGGQ